MSRRRIYPSRCGTEKKIGVSTQALTPILLSASIRRPRENCAGYCAAKDLPSFFARLSAFFSDMVFAGFFLASRLLDRSFAMISAPMH